MAIDIVINSFRSPLYDPMYAIKQHFIHFYSIWQRCRSFSHCTPLSIISPTEFVVPRRMAQFTTVLFTRHRNCVIKSPQRPFCRRSTSSLRADDINHHRNTLHCPSLTLFYDDDERDLLLDLCLHVAAHSEQNFFLLKL